MVRSASTQPPTPRPRRRLLALDSSLGGHSSSRASAVGDLRAGPRLASGADPRSAGFTKPTHREGDAQTCHRGVLLSGDNVQSQGIAIGGHLNESWPLGLQQRWTRQPNRYSHREQSLTTDTPRSATPVHHDLLPHLPAVRFLLGVQCDQHMQHDPAVHHHRAGFLTSMGRGDGTPAHHSVCALRIPDGPKPTRSSTLCAH